MNTPAKIGTPATAAKARAAKKPQKSAKRLAAEAAHDAAKSEQEKAIARSHLKSVTFEDLARQRVRRALKVLGHIENLANRAAYTWTDEQAGKILGALNDKIKNVTLKFAGTKQKGQDFDL
jgi:hypothetical protein